MLKVFRRSIATAVVFGCLQVNIAGTALANQPVNVFVNSDAIHGDQPAYLEEVTNITYVPLRAVVEALNGTVNWDSNAQEITIEKNGKIYQLRIGSDKVLIDGKKTLIDAPVQLNKETMRSLVPLRFFSDVVQCEVKVSATAGVGIFDENSSQLK